MGNIKTTIAKNILFYRKKNKLSQKALAEKLNVKHNTISSWENCTNSVDIDSLFKMCNIFNISLNDITGNQVNNGFVLSEVEQQVIKHFRKLNSSGKKKADEYITDLSEQKKYTAADAEPNTHAQEIIKSAIKDSMQIKNNVNR